MGDAITKAAGSKIRVREITDADVCGVIDLLTRGFTRHGRRFWVEVLERLNQHIALQGLPKFGYLLESDSTLVGAILLIHSKVSSGADGAIRCCVSSWYVEPSYRGYASFLAAKALKHKDVTYLNITAAPHTRPIAKALGYCQYSSGIFFALPMLNRSTGTARVETFDPQRHRDVDPFERELLLSHADYGCICLWVETPEGGESFVFRPRVFKGIVVCAQMVYCRDVDHFVRYAGPIGRYLAARGRPLVMLDANGPIAGLVGKYFDGRTPRYFRGPNRPRLGDLAYTETAMFGV
jgi:hypothetical protein